MSYTPDLWNLDKLLTHAKHHTSHREFHRMRMADDLRAGGDRAGAAWTAVCVLERALGKWHATTMRARASAEAIQAQQNRPPLLVHDVLVMRSTPPQLMLEPGPALVVIFTDRTFSAVRLPPAGASPELVAEAMLLMHRRLLQDMKTHRGEL